MDDTIDPWNTDLGKMRGTHRVIVLHGQFHTSLSGRGGRSCKKERPMSYVRAGTSTAELSPSQTQEYIGQRFE